MLYTIAIILVVLGRLLVSGYAVALHLLLLVAA